MKKIIVSFIFAALPIAALAFAEDDFTVSGDLTCYMETNIYVCLHNQQTCANWKKDLPSGPFTQIIRADLSGKKSFTFNGVPKGEYVLFAFADENGNGKLDYDPSGRVEEPIAVHKAFLSGRSLDINWLDQKFEVDKDITGLDMMFFK
jgi:uncharacterized protein (DUF2141 family)